MKNLFICALVVKLLLFTSVEKAYAFSTAPFEEPGGGTAFFTPGGVSNFEHDDVGGTFFEPDRSGSLQQQTAFGQIRNFFQTSILRNGNSDPCYGLPTPEDFRNCCAVMTGFSAQCDTGVWDGDTNVDLPISNGLPFLIALALLHFAIVYFRRKQRIA